MVRVNVRRLAAIDMFGGSGTLLRRRLILAEFLLAGVGVTALGILGFLGGGLTIFGIWLVGIGLNYVPLALYALAFSRPGALEAELAGVDIAAELRHYMKAQLWVFVPALFTLLAAAQLSGNRG